MRVECRAQVRPILCAKFDVDRITWRTHDVQVVFWFDVLDYHSLFWFCFVIICTFAVIAVWFYICLDPWSIKKNITRWKWLSVHVLGPEYEDDLNSLASGRFGYNSKNWIFNLVLLIGIFRFTHDNALRLMPQDLTDDKSMLVQVMAWCRQATSHFQSQCWLSSLTPYCVTIGHNELKSGSEWMWAVNCVGVFGWLTHLP